MNENELIERLNSISQYSLEECGRGWESNNQLVEQDENSWGEWMKIEDVARVLGLKVSWNGKLIA